MTAMVAMTVAVKPMTRTDAAEENGPEGDTEIPQ